MHDHSYGNLQKKKKLSNTEPMAENKYFTGKWIPETSPTLSQGHVHANF